MYPFIFRNSFVRIYQCVTVEKKGGKYFIFLLRTCIFFSVFSTGFLSKAIYYLYWGFIEILKNINQLFVLSKSSSLLKNVLSHLYIWIIQRNSMFENPLMYIFHFNSSESDVYFYHPHVYQYIYHPYFVHKWYWIKMLLLLKRKCRNIFVGGKDFCPWEFFQNPLF